VVTALTYDNLPPGSSILREWNGETLILSSPAGELSSRARKRAAGRAALQASWTTTAIFLIIVLLGISFTYPQNTSRLLSPWILALAALCFACTFLLNWNERWRAMRDDAESGLNEQTILAIGPERIDIEIEGPKRTISVSHRREFILDIAAHVDFVQRRPDRLVIHFNDGCSLELLLGRAPAELEWIAKTLRQVIDRSTESRPAPGS
jgi:hypothetical protein